MPSGWRSTIALSCHRRIWVGPRQNCELFSSDTVHYDSSQVESVMDILYPIPHKQSDVTFCTNFALTLRHILIIVVAEWRVATSCATRCRYCAVLASAVDRIIDRWTYTSLGATFRHSHICDKTSASVECIHVLTDLWTGDSKLKNDHILTKLWNAVIRIC